jgi:N-acetylmuramoyl-L-alanine amidase
MFMKPFQKYLIFLLLVLVAITECLFAQENYIRLIFPSQDTTMTQQLRQRFNGATLPGSRLTLNDSVIHVYPSGAFAAFPAFRAGWNQVELLSVHPVYGTAKKTIWFDCKLPVPEKSTTEFQVDYVRLVPDQDHWLLTGDFLSIRVKGQPGNTLKVFGQILHEMPESETNGVAGIYQGRYQIKPDDKFELRQVEVEMTNKAGEKIVGSSRTMISANGQEMNRFARTTGKMPYLAMGLGTDRLGGAKYGYLDTAVLVKITGRIGEMYLLKLSAGNTAWINKSHIRLLPEAYIPPSPMLTGSYSVSGDNRFDYVRIGLPERLPYTSNMELDPSRIEVDIYGVSSNTNWITQLNSAKEVENIYYRQIAPDVIRLIVELKNRQCWGYSIYYENRALVLKIKRQPELLKLSNLTIALDAGHGGNDNGALGSTGLQEKKVNLEMAYKLKAALEKKGARVVMTRSDDLAKNNIDKWLALIPQNPDILLSIHNNSIGNSDPLRVKGTSTYYKYIAFRPLSVYMYNELLKCGLAEFGNIGSFNFTLNSPTEFINTLLELAFMSHPEDEMKLMDTRFQDKMVRHIVIALENFLKDTAKKK